MAEGPQPLEEKRLPSATWQSIKVYKRRWVILVIFVMYSAANSFQWMEYSIMSNIIEKYYRVSSIYVNWTSIVYMAVYPIIVIPVSYIIDKKGLRVAALIGGIGTFLAATIKIFSLRRNLFYVVLIGQTIGSTAQVFILCLPAKIAAVWFKPEEASTACSLAVFGTQLGFALGFILPTTIVKNHNLILMIESDLRKLCWGLAIYTVPIVIAIIYFFPRVPLLPPSVMQLETRRKKPPNFSEFMDSFMKILRKRGFTAHMVAYGINIGVFAAIGTFLNQFVLYYFPNSAEDAGRMGLLMVICGMIGSIIFGVYLDKSHKYKETTMFIYIMSVVSAAAFTFALKMESKIATYITAAVVGFFTQSYMPVGFEFAVELTFPSDESVTTGLLNAMTQALGVLITLGLGVLNRDYGPFWSMLSQIILLTIGAVLTQIAPNEKKRQDALKKSEQEGEALVKLKLQF